MTFVNMVLIDGLFSFQIQPFSILTIIIQFFQVGFSNSPH